MVEEQSLFWPVPNLKDGDWGYQPPRGHLGPGCEEVAEEKANSHREKICRWGRGRCRSPSPRAGRGWLAGPLPEAGPSLFPAAGSWGPSLTHPAAWSGQSGGATSPPHLLHLTAQHLKVCGVKIIGKGDGHFSSTYGTCCASPLRWRYSPWASDYTSWDPSGISPSFNLYTLK